MSKIKYLLFCFLCCVSLNAQQPKLADAPSDSDDNTYLEQAIAESKDYEDDHLALELLETAVAKVSKSTLSDSTLAEAYHRIGIHHYYLDQERKAIEAWKQAIQLRTNIYPSHHIKIVKGYRNIGNAYVVLNELNNAQIALQRALDLNLENPETDEVILADLYRELGYIFSQQDDVKQAEIYLETAQNLCERVFADEPWELAHMYDYRYMHEQRQKNAEKMIYFAQKSRAEFERMEEKYEEDYWGLADSYNNLAIAYEMSGNFSQAIDFYERSLSTNLSYLENRLEEASKNYANLIGIYRKQAKYTESQKNVDAALKLVERLDNKSLHSLILHDQAKVYFDQRAYKEAAQGYHRAIELLVPNFESDDIFENPNTQNAVIGDRPNLIASLQEKANTLLILGNQEQSEKYIQAAVATYDSIAKYIDQVRLDFESDESKSFLANQAKSIFEKAIQANLDLYAFSKDVAQIENAFNFVERSKAVILLDAIKESQAKINANIPEDLLARERQLRDDLQRIEQALLESKEAEKEQLQANLVLINRNLERLVDTLENEFSSYHALKYSTALADLEEVQKEMLRPNQAMIQYFVGEKKLYIFYIRPSSAPKVYTTPLDFPLADWIKQFRTGIYGQLKANDTNNLDESYTLHAWRLYEKLIQPIAKENILEEQLLIIPDGILGYIPFDALLTQEVPIATYGDYYNYPYLIRQHQLSYTYSATLLQTMNEASIAPDFYQVLAFAPSFGQDMALASDRGGSVDERAGLSPLLHNQREADAINMMLGGEHISGVNATKQRFLDLAAKYSYLHLSSHARMNDEHPDYSYIAFTQASNEQLDEEELLFVSDLYNTPLNAEMVVLSACETGLGKLSKGEGIISLARAFSYAGARSVITTLWRVNDQETANLMIDFYEQLQAGQSKDEALWQAKKRFLDEGIHPHPYYWAGFMPIGNMSPIETDGGSWQWYLAIGACALLVLFFFIRKSS